MSDTPRTDKATRMAFTSEHMVEIEEAQNLERELAQSKEANAGLMRACDNLERELAEITKQRNKLIEVLKDCENYLKPHEKGVCDEESDESGWILLCHIRLILAEIKRKKL